jgi:hypothetical protein
MWGSLTRRRYMVSTVFVDHFSGLSYVQHLQLSTDAEHTLGAKRAFERFAKAHGVSVCHYHADNHIFDSKHFVEEVHKARQTISYCRVNAHHQNGKAEKKIRDLQELARMMILHARQRWPMAITVNLWPYALRMANEVSNVSPILDGKDHISPIELFSQVQIKPEVKFTHTFGSPVYILDAKLQAGKPKPKWERHSHVGIYLGPSPRHSRKVALVLNLSTGHVSPQFHCLFVHLRAILHGSRNGRPRQDSLANKALSTINKLAIKSHEESRVKFIETFPLKDQKRILRVWKSNDVKPE